MEKKDQYQVGIQIYAHVVNFYDKKIYNYNSLLYETPRINVFVFLLILLFKLFKFIIGICFLNFLLFFKILTFYWFLQRERKEGVKGERQR